MSLVLPFNSTMDLVSKVDQAVTLPKPDSLTSKPKLRYPGSDLICMSALSGAGAKLLAPARGAARVFDITGYELAAGLTLDTLLEFEPIPFAARGFFANLPTGMPTFYFAFNKAETDLINPALFGERFRLAGNELLSFTAVGKPCLCGVAFQRRIQLAPASWIEQFEAANRPLDAAAADVWQALLSARYTKSALRLLSAQGRPLSGVTIEVRRIKDADGTSDLLERSIAATDKLADLGGEFLPLPGFTHELSIKKSGDPYLPLLCLFESGQSSTPQSKLVLKPLPGKRTRHLLASDLSHWFAANRQKIGSTIRYHLNSRVEPLIDGHAGFRALIDDLLAAEGAGFGAHFAGWDFGEFEMRPGLKGPGLAGTPEAGTTVTIDTTLPGLCRRIRASGGDVRLLANKLITIDMLEFNKFSDKIALGLALVTILFGVSGYLIFTKVARDNIFNTTEFLIAGGSLLAIVGGLTVWIVKDGNLTPWILDVVANKNSRMIKELTALSPNIALFSALNARFSDNPLYPLDRTSIILPDVGDLKLSQIPLTKILPYIGTWHAKTQLVKRAPDPEIAPLSGPTARSADYTAYVGGIDIAPNRFDGPGHQGKPLEPGNWSNIQYPFHDVHARIVGPAAHEVFSYWDQRWKWEKSIQPASDLPNPGEPVPDPAIAMPDLTKDFPAQLAQHIVQVGITAFSSRDGSATAFPADTTIFDTLIRAISSAREYIYIEDQYFTPSWEKAGKTGFVDALLNAADHTERLVILVPVATDQFHGNVQRRHIFTALRTKWGNRVKIGVPMRRPILPSSPIVPNLGRCILYKNLEEKTDPNGLSMLEIGPISQVPSDVPFWLWIEGELMLAFGQATHDKEHNLVKIQAWRNRYGTKAKGHKMGAAVTMALMKGIYVHSKVMMIDDLFVAIGSANCNRRGHFFDNEIAAFAIPQQLKAAADNPARALRTRLWAEHLGLAPEMGPVLLEDPLQAFELFSRSFFEGNRFVPFELMDPTPEAEYAMHGLDFSGVLGSLGAIAKSLIAESVWNYASDPTGAGDPDPTEGPVSP